MEAERLSNWNRTTGLIYKDVLIYAIAAACGAFFAIIPLCKWLSEMCYMASMIGFVAFYMRLKDLTVLADSADADALKKLSLGILLYVASVLLSKIPVAGIILDAIASIIAFLFMFLAYSAIKKSTTFPNAEGAKLLTTALILGMVGALLSVIPIVGIVGKILLIVEFVLIIMGWKKIATPAA